MFPVGIGLRDPRSQKGDLGHPSISPFDIAEGTSFVISLPTRLSESAAPNEQEIKPTESISIFSVHFTLNLPQASRLLLGMTKRRVGCFQWELV